MVTVQGLNASRVMHGANNTTTASLANGVPTRDGGLSSDASRELNLPPVTVLGVTLFLCLVIFISVFGNILALVMFRVCREVRNITSYFIISLCCSDLMVTAFSMPFWISFIHIGWPSKENGAPYKLWICLDIFCGCFSITNLALISVERYVYIVHPFHYDNIFTKQRALIAVAATPVYSLVACILGYIRMSTNSPGLVMPLLFTAYVIPVGVMGFTYGCIFQVTRSHCKFLAEQKADRKRFISVEMTRMNNGGWSYGKTENKNLEPIKSTKKTVSAEKQSLCKSESKNGKKLQEGIKDWNDYVDTLGKKRQAEDAIHVVVGAHEQQCPDAIVPAPAEMTDCDPEDSDIPDETAEVTGKKGSFEKLRGIYQGRFWQRWTMSKKDELEEKVVTPKTSRLQCRMRSFKSDLKAAKAVGMIIATFIILWTPFMLIVLLTSINVQVRFGAVIFVKCLHYSNSAINPVLYVALNRIFRTALKKIPLKLRKL